MSNGNVENEQFRINRVNEVRNKEDILNWELLKLTVEWKGYVFICIHYLVRIIYGEVNHIAGTWSANVEVKNPFGHKLTTRTVDKEVHEFCSIDTLPIGAIQLH